MPVKFRKILMVFVLVFGASILFAGIPEVDIDKIPAQYLNAPAGSRLPNGVEIWDVPQALAAMNNAAMYLWIDNRPTSLFNDGTLRPAVQLAYHKNEKPMTPKDGPALTAQQLRALMAGKAKVVMFCQGPKCHRSFNAANRAVDVWGIPASQVVWFRGGFPGLYKAVLGNPALAKRKNQYIKGNILNR